MFTVTNGVSVKAAETQAKLLSESYEAEDSAQRYVVFKPPMFRTILLMVCSGPLITAHAADVASPESIELAMASILEKHGRIDHLVTCAGICENFPAVSYPYTRMQKLWAINVDGSYLFSTAVARHLLERKATGSVVLIGSMSGTIVNMPQMQTPYNVSKAAVRQMARSLAIEWAQDGIRVNCISPGYMGTAL